ncbi:MAG: enoyl-CoA hydratase-related protein [Dehalococcoidia bacterium]|nr:enoyl-CoA hydratase-related protein [Dehalococcoidia bacterium]
MPSSSPPCSSTSPSPYDIGTRKAKELMFESRFLTADEAMGLGFVNQVHDQADLERETVNYALRVAENSPMNLRMAKLAANKSQDLMGYTSSLESGLSDYMLMANNRGAGRVEGMRRLGGVDLAVRGLRGERPGLTPKE